MPSPSSVHEQLTDILVRLVGCPAGSVVPTADLKALGVDSLTILEVGEELGRRFGIHLSDATIDSMKTVQDAIDAVVKHDGTAAAVATPRTKAAGAASAPSAQPAAPTRPRPRDPEDDAARRRGARTFAITFIFLGLVIGGALGLGGAALVSATGISDVNLPPITPVTTPTPVEKTTPEPTPQPSTAPAEVKPTINTSSEKVSPGERFYLSGAFPDSPEGQDVQVEVRDPGGSWDDFPIQTKTRDGGIFRTELYTSRTGAREFRVTNKATGVSTPKVKVEIG